MPRLVQDRLTIADVSAYLLSIQGITIQKWAVYHWTTHGKRSYSNKVVKLRCERILRKKYTRKSWVQEFILELEK